MNYLKKSIAATFGAAAGCVLGVAAGIGYTVVDNFDRLAVMNTALEKYDEAYHANPAALVALEKTDADVAWVGGLVRQVELTAAVFALAGALAGGWVGGRKGKEPVAAPGAGPQ